MKVITSRQRRARLGQRHYLASGAADAEQVTRSLVAIHSSDPATVYLTMRARVDGFGVSHLEELLYDRRILVRHWAMRRTLWVFHQTILPLAVSSSTRSIGERERKRTVRLIEEGGVAEDGEAWLQTVIPQTLDLIRREGDVLARRLSSEIPELAKKVEFRNEAGRLMGSTGMSSRVLVQLGLESRVLRGRPTGSWVSGQYRWAASEQWLGGPIDDVPRREASARLVESWLFAYGPATETDLRWWSGWPARQVRSALDDVGAIEVDLDGEGVGLMLPNDTEDVDEPPPWVAFLPSLDTTIMGWKERSWYLGSHEPDLFDRNGNAGPTVWLDGRVVGGWTQRENGEVVYGLLEDIAPDRVRDIDEERDRLQDWLGDATVTARFRSPHDRRLSS